MNITFEPLPMSGNESADREIKSVNRLMDAQSRALSGIGIDDKDIDSALEGRFGSAVKEMLESLLPSMKVFEDELDDIREIIENLTTGTRENREMAERVHKADENFRDLTARLLQIREILEGRSEERRVGE